MASEELTGPFESVVEMACLMHDIGNPPFGHFGEAAINDWFRQRLGARRCARAAADRRSLRSAGLTPA